MTVTHNFTLTGRQLEVARLWAEDLTMTQVAERLAVGRGTIMTHIANIYRKLDVRGRAGVTRWLIRQGLLAA